MFEAISTSENHGRISASSSNDSVFTEGWSKTIEGLVADAERHLVNAEAKQDQLVEQIQALQNAPPTVSTGVPGLISVIENHYTGRDKQHGNGQAERRTPTCQGSMRARQETAGRCDGRKGDHVRGAYYTPLRNK